jgi:hypothetical protein
MMPPTLRVMATCCALDVGFHQRDQTIFVSKSHNALPVLRKASARRWYARFV